MPGSNRWYDTTELGLGRIEFAGKGLTRELTDSRQPAGKKINSKSRASIHILRYRTNNIRVGDSGARQPTNNHEQVIQGGVTVLPPPRNLEPCPLHPCTRPLQVHMTTPVLRNWRPRSYIIRYPPAEKHIVSTRH